MSGEKKSWLVWSENSGPGVYGCLASAKHAAERLCIVGCGPVRVYESVMVCVPTAEPVRWELIDGVVRS